MQNCLSPKALFLAQNAPQTRSAAGADSAPTDYLAGLQVSGSWKVRGGWNMKERRKRGER